MLHIETFTLGDWMTNCYVVRADGRACWIVDAGFEPAPMIRYIEQHGLTPERIVLTHAHVDHIAGLGALRDRFPDAPVAIHEAERAFLGEPALNLSIVLEQAITAPDADATLAHGDALTLAEHTFEVRHTPGHSPGGITLYQREHGVALVGDALFAGSVGRTDFPTSDHSTLIEAIRSQLLTLPGDTRVLSGHGPETTIARERATNPFLQ
jgi:hydroxyacylglutathione hydrolase